MRKAMVVLGFVTALCSTSTPGFADDTGAAGGAVAGAVVGAVVGGPIGAVIGAAVGGVVGGAATGPNTVAAVRHEQPPPVAHERGLVQREPSRRARLMQGPQTTGGVVETTCVRDRRGNTKCRNEVVR
jgi:phage tail tape-measure protein